jgi:STAS-like domain of unknown function (DUF4325)
VRSISIEPVPGTTLAESKDEARELRVEILAALAAGEEVELDFGKVGTATQSYVHALISEAVRRYGPKTFDLLLFRNCSEEVKQVVYTVCEYTLLAAEEARDLKSPVPINNH